MKKKNIRIGFIGAGSIGSLFGGLIASIESVNFFFEVILLGRRNHIEKINKNGLIVQMEQKRRKINNIQAFDNPNAVEELMLKNPDFKFDFIFLTTKAYDTESALFQYKEIVNSSKWLIILQNGIGNEESVEKFCDEEKIVRALTTFGALLKEPGIVALSGLGVTKVGFVSAKNQHCDNAKLKRSQSDLFILNHILNLAGLNSTISEDITRDCWEKVFVNIGINAFGALTRLKNGELLKHEGLKNLMREAVEEAVKISKLKNIKLLEKNYVDVVYDVALKTSKNKNSMLQDVLSGKKTEIEHINGKILEYANQLGEKVPINETLTCLVKGLEKSYITA